MINFIFMDEGHSSRTEYFALTAILIPFSQYDDSRNLFHQLLLRFQESGRWTVNREFMELHGFKMLNWIDDVEDDLKIEMFDGVVDIVERLGLRTFRVGGIQGEFPEPLRRDDVFLRYCWGELIRILEPVLENETVIPVMDMLEGPRLAAVSGLITFTDQMRAVGKHEHLSIRNLENIVGEVFYADSRFSLGIQLADVIGYLRQVADRVWLGRELSPFQGGLNVIAKRLDPFIVEHRLPVPRVEYFRARLTVETAEPATGVVTE